MEINKLTEIVKNVFPDFDISKLTLETTLEEIDGWDSMNAVSLTIELESAFAIKLGNYMFKNDQTVNSVLELIASKQESQ